MNHSRDLPRSKFDIMPFKIVHGDCRDYLREMSPTKTIFLDPPDNIGLPYGEYVDHIKDEFYLDWLDSVLQLSFTKSQIIWLSYYHKWDLEIAYLLRWILKLRHSAWSIRKIIWHFNFGNYQSENLTNSYRPIWLMTAPNIKLNFDSIRVISERMLLGDARSAGPKIPDDLWDIPRVVGNSKERRAWHPTQHPEELMERILKVSGGPIVDLFGGTGTTLRVGRRLQIPTTVVEIDSGYVKKIWEENPEVPMIPIHSDEWLTLRRVDRTVSNTTVQPY